VIQLLVISRKPKKKTRQNIKISCAFKKEKRNGRAGDHVRQRDQKKKLFYTKPIK